MAPRTTGRPTGNYASGRSASPGVFASDIQRDAVAAGWFAAGKTLGVAVDFDTGTMRVSVDGGDWAVAFPHGCAPSAAVGAALFPALSGWRGARARCNWGACAARPMKFAPPSGEYMAVGLAQKVP
jgi:hypothetical protein